MMGQLEIIYIFIHRALSEVRRKLVVPRRRPDGQDVQETIVQESGAGIYVSSTSILSLFNLSICFSIEIEVEQGNERHSKI